ncbi:MAG: phosphate regulon sensor histidine kinase PhoR [Orrella sp.]
MQWHKTLLVYSSCIIIAASIQLIWHNPVGWIALALGAGTYLTYRRYQASKVASWARAPNRVELPSDVGPWSEVVSELNRYIRLQQDLLSESQETTAAIMSAAQALPVGVIAMDGNLEISWFNRAAQQQFDLDEETDIGKNLLHLIRQPDFIKYARQRQWPDSIIQKVAHGNSERLLMLQFVTYARHQRLLISRDLTQIDRLETTRRDFVANVSHELRTPLTVLAGFLETIREAPDDSFSEEQRQQYLALMQEQASRMQSIVADLLTLSDLENNPSADRQTVDVPALLEAARQQAQALSGGRHEFFWDLDSELTVQGSASELASAFSNLLTNAVRYTPNDGKISVFWGQDANGKLRYSVTDTGIGIAAEHIPRLSERFYRVDRGRSRAAGGTGLGLAITKHIAMRHGAQLVIDSRLGQGSTFSLVFEPEPEPEKNPQTEAQANADNAAT